MTIALSLSANTPPSKEVARVADRILNSKRVVFVAGAGISCSAGIPVRHLGIIQPPFADEPGLSFSAWLV